MFTVTDEAHIFLARLIESKDYSAEVAVRLLAGEEGVELVADGERVGDSVFEYEGRAVLFVDRKVTDLLVDQCLIVDGLGLQFRRQPEGKG